MSEKDEAVMVIDKPHFTVKLHTSLLEVDLKEGVRKRLEDALESHPHLRESIGLLFQNVVPLDVQIKDIETAFVDNEGRAKIIVPNRRDITIPLEPEESQELVEKLNELIPIEKRKAAQDLSEEQKTEKEVEPQRGQIETEEYRDRAGRI
jgi:hypothetical protein